MRATLRLWKQTSHPPKRVLPLAANPLTRWSLRLPKWRELTGSLTGASVGLEGCHSAFNATNSIRTCLYFQTAHPPTFLTAESWRAIEHVQVRSSREEQRDVPPSPSSSEKTEAVMTLLAAAAAAAPAPATTPTEDPFDGLATFGEDAFFVKGNAPDTAERRAAYPIVAVENFTDRAQSVMQTRLPAALRDGKVRLVVGHENWGVRRSLLRAADSGRDTGAGAALPIADMIVYVPQYGTISSLNVVTSLGIALFYCYLDGNCPEARTIYSAHAGPQGRGHEWSSSSSDDDDDHFAALRENILAYQDFFKTSLPTPSPPAIPALEASLSTAADTTTTAIAVDGNVNTTPRADRRPIHPVFYQKEMTAIQDVQRRYRRTLLQYSQGMSASASADSSAAPFFGLSVLYENVFDQRNFGGLIRNANAFLVDHILYVGRRKYNVVGAVGSYHYTPPIYLGQLPCEEGREGDTAETASAASEVSWSASLKTQVNGLYGHGAASTTLRPAWWLLDCGHGFLYDEDPFTTGREGHTRVERDCDDMPGREATSTSPSSLQLYRTLLAKGRVRSLCETEASLHDALAGGVVLLVPQEGKLPDVALMQLCTGVLTVLPAGVHHAERWDKMCGAEGVGHRGLPSQVASGIALQRISAVLHPRLAAL